MFTDLSGKKSRSLAGYYYYQLFLDDFSRKLWIYFLKKKSEAPAKIQRHINMVEREKAPLKVAFIRSDGAKELNSNHLRDEIYKGEIQQEISAPYSQAQNPVERYNGVIANSARCMMLRANSPKYDWPFACNHAVQLCNLTTSKVVNCDMSPQEAYDGLFRKIGWMLRGVYGCLVVAKVFIRGKEDPKGRNCSYLGLASMYKCFIVRDISSHKNSLKEYYARDLVFFPRVMPYRNTNVPRPIPPALTLAEQRSEQQEQDNKEDSKDEVEEVVHDLTGQPDNDVIYTGEIEEDIHLQEEKSVEQNRVEDSVFYDEEDYNISYVEPEGSGDELDEKHVDVDTPLPAPPDDLPPHESLRRGSRYREPSMESLQRFQAYMSSMKAVPDDYFFNGHLEDGIFFVDDDDTPTPNTQKQAYESDEKECWIEGEIDEMSQIYFHEVATLVRRTPGMKVMTSRFLYKKKKQNGVVTRWKVRLVLRGFQQEEGIDYQETFSSQARMSTIKLILFLVTMYDLEMFSFDIKTFFLYGSIEENLYMEQPPGYHQRDAEKWVWKLNRSLYGAKQAPRKAGEMLKRVFAELHMTVLMSEPNVYIFTEIFEGNFEVIVLATWVDDNIGGSSTSRLRTQLITGLRRFFELEEFLEPNHFLGFEIERNRATRYMKIHQTPFLLDVLAQFNMSDCKPKTIPWHNITPVEPATVKLEPAYPYQKLVGSVLWLCHTRKDVCYYIHFLCQYMGRYGSVQWNLAVGLLRYLSGTREIGLVYDLSEYPLAPWGEGLTVTPWVDSNFAARPWDSKSSSGVVFQINGCTIDAATVLQKRPAQDTAEAEWYGLVCVSKWVEWYVGLLNELLLKIVLPVRVKHDNQLQVVRCLLRDSMKLGRTLHWRIAQHYPRHLFQTGLLDIEYWCTDDMCADMLTKALTYVLLKKHRAVIQGKQ
jgi:hypothetical protein